MRVTSSVLSNNSATDDGSSGGAVFYISPGLDGSMDLPSSAQRLQLHLYNSVFLGNEAVSAALECSCSVMYYVGYVDCWYLNNWVGTSL